MNKRIVLTGGGTAGHVTPHLSLIPRLKDEGYEIHYIGTKDGIERGMIEKFPYVMYHSITCGKLRRYFSIKNFSDPFKVMYGVGQASHIIGKLKPDVCFSKGGFVGVPVVIGASIHHVPAVCHESDLTPGLANRISARFATRIATSFEECAKALGDKAVYTGTPMRPSLFAGSREKGFRLAGFDGSKPVLLMTGGSLGAQSVNQALRECLADILPRMDVLHLCGKGNLDAALEGTKGYKQLEFLSDEMPDAFACADLVLSRAGSNTLCELLALGKPMLLVPYPLGAGRGDQIENAESFEKRGLARVLKQEDMNRESLSKALIELLDGKDELAARVKAYPVKDGTDAVLCLIEQARLQHKSREDQA